MKLTKAERKVMADINAAARKAFKSKPTLKILGDLDHREIISFDPFTMTASITPLGHELLKE